MNPLELCVLDLNQLLHHEHYDNRRVERLSDDLQKANILRSPPIVAEWQGKYVILDGATRASALNKLNCPHIVVQIVKQDSQDTILSTWNHIVHTIDLGDLFDAIENIPRSDTKKYGIVEISDKKEKPLQRISGNIKILPAKSLEPNISSPETLFTIVDRDKQMYIVQGSEDYSLKHLYLSHAVNAYSRITNVVRTLDSDVQLIQNQVESFTALIKFPSFTMQAVLTSAIAHKLLPAGVTRFLIANRVIGINIPLNILFSNDSLSQKNKWLNETIKTKYHQNKVRHYTEPVIIVED